MKPQTTDTKELRTKKCSIVGCKDNVESMKDGKYYCNYHFQKVRERQVRIEYWK
ncbi:hypothetical protein LCGC14_3094010 [marine sediment metagenome]|uniref:Uncharacterized protein n=1 Tax=marine sediment metagenome TaxID=412755 RepID=A0A0F8WYJ4_9ZZZZ